MRYEPGDRRVRLRRPDADRQDLGLPIPRGASADGLVMVGMAANGAALVVGTAER